ncbi:MAG TPA: formate dehydrogenase accessory sulfurtransferase FdhD [Kofleriaceae bacterium]|nr:formate dehydrogenase accessory sulfurtransferase FdhD [Kofleriaceae bacterium]
MERRNIERIDALRGVREAAADQLVEEGPLAIRARGEVVATILRTPGSDRELVRGLLIAEGLSPAGEIVIEGDEARIDVELRARGLVSTAACGLCGRVAIAELETRMTEVRSELIVSAPLVASLPEKLRAAQAEFEQTGGLHASGLFDERGELACIREDIGRHNALDKVIGWAFEAGRLPWRGIVVVSGRLGYELAQKVVAAGAPIVAAVSAPSALAVDVCERFGVTACGFVRGGRMNVYAHGWRIAQ